MLELALALPLAFATLFKFALERKLTGPSKDIGMQAAATSLNAAKVSLCDGFADGKRAAFGIPSRLRQP